MLKIGRAAIAVIVIAAVVIGITLLFVPLNGLPWLRIVLTPLVGVVFCVGAIAMQVAMPSIVTMTRERIDLAQGASATRIRRDRIRTCVLRRIGNLDLLVLRYRDHSGRPRRRTVLVAAGTDFESLRHAASLLAPSV